jgi:hypothetical protein
MAFAISKVTALSLPFENATAIKSLGILEIEFTGSVSDVNLEINTTSPLFAAATVAQKKLVDDFLKTIEPQTSLSCVAIEDLKNKTVGTVATGEFKKLQTAGVAGFGYTLFAGQGVLAGKIIVTSNIQNGLSPVSGSK